MSALDLLRQASRVCSPGNVSYIESIFVEKPDTHTVILERQSSFLECCIKHVIYLTKNLKVSCEVSSMYDIICNTYILTFAKCPLCTLSLRNIYLRIHLIQHDDCGTLLIINQMPEVNDCVWQRHLCQ